MTVATKTITNRFAGRCDCGAAVDAGAGFAALIDGRWQVRCEAHRTVAAGASQPLAATASAGDQRIAGPADAPHTLLSGHAASPYQAAVFDHFRFGRGSRIVKAVAGSGKTTTMKNALRYLPEWMHVQMYAFNTEAAAQLDEAIAELRALTGRAFAHVRGGTFHSVGFRAIVRYLALPSGQVKPDSGKCRRLLKVMVANREDVDEYLRMYASFVLKLVGLAKGEGIGALIPDLPAAWYDLVDHHGLYLDSGEATVEEGIELSRKLLTRSNEAAKAGDIDFDDQIYLVVLWKLRLWENHVVIADEAQDTNPVRRAMLHLSLRNGGRLYAVGDPCQPPGTMIEVATRRGKFNFRDKRSVPIETLAVGDTVASWNGCSGHRDETSQKEGARYEVIEGITRRDYTGDMISVEAAGKLSRYTINHICFTRYRRQAWSVYLMKRGSAFRIGMARMFDRHGNGAGPLGRLYSEDADAVWVLDVFDTRRDALLTETKISVRYGIPQTMFTGKFEMPSFQQHELEDIWADINNEAMAVKVLELYGRRYEYPFYLREDHAPKPGNKNPYFSLRRPHELRACNLMIGHEALVRLPSGKARWIPIERLSRKRYEGDVYSLSVSRTKTYFADGILTHNCQSIYGFTGASTDAMDLIAREFNAAELPLTVSYRCAKRIVERAQTWVPYIEASDGAPEGAVFDDLPLAEALARLTPADAILCRQTAPLVTVAYGLIARGRPCRILGKEIGDGLVALIEQMKTTGIDRLVKKLEVFRDRETAKFIAKGEEVRAEAVADRVGCVLVIINGLHENEQTVPALIAKIGAMFADPKKVVDPETGKLVEEKQTILTLATQHKSKGKEWDRVAILRPDLNPSKAARMEWMQEQEWNICYVAATRAKRELIYVADGDMNLGEAR